MFNSFKLNSKKLYKSIINVSMSNVQKFWAPTLVLSVEPSTHTRVYEIKLNKNKKKINVLY